MHWALRTVWTAALVVAGLYFHDRLVADESNGPVTDVPASESSVDGPGLADPGSLLRLELSSFGATPEGCVLAGRDASAQLVVTAHYDSGQERDVTGSVTYRIEPEALARVDATGYVLPQSEGAGIIHVGLGEFHQELPLQVTHLVDDLPVNFPNQVVPVFTKFGCNGGGCHGKSGGQNGFRLSLLGFIPEDDYKFLVKETRGRRLFPAAPDQSLLLRKGAGLLPHGGGARLEVDALPYQVLRRWIEQGMPYGTEQDPTLTRIEVYPHERVMPRQGTQQLLVVAHYSDGTMRDVTRMTQFESNDADLGEVSTTGLVKTTKGTGSVAIMTRFQSHVDVFRATVPLGLPVDQLPPAKNFIDELVFGKLKQLGLPPSEPSDDSTYLRRVFIDVAGRLPSREETELFLANGAADKRDQLVDQLLASPDYADYFANKWSAILRNRREDRNLRLTSYAFHDWIRESMWTNKPYDQFVGEVLSASGQVGRNPAVAWFHEVRDASAQVEDTAQLFLGLRIQCARCHHHPFEKWSQNDYYGMSAFFSRVGRKSSELRGKDHIFHNPGNPSATNPATGKELAPAPLGDEPMQIDPYLDPRIALSDWLGTPNNPFFAKALVNRYWKHFFGRGLVDPEDDMRVTNPACNPALLDALARDFIDSGFDLKRLVRRICTSQTYGLSALPNAYNQADKQNFSRFYPRRLNAEVLLDAIDQLTATPSRFNGVPLGTRAVQLPDNAFDSYFLTVFGRPNAASACECERSADVNLAQCLHLLNSDDVQQKVAGQRAQSLAGEKRDLSERLHEIYLVAFSRPPTDDELQVAIQYISDRQDAPQKAFEDILWALMNTKEFVFNH